MMVANNCTKHECVYDFRTAGIFNRLEFHEREYMNRCVLQTSAAHSYPILPKVPFMVQIYKVVVVIAW
jgi:hypothetical protein